jgi:hypothetical protein
MKFAPSKQNFTTYTLSLKALLTSIKCHAEEHKTTSTRLLKLPDAIEIVQTAFTEQYPPELGTVRLSSKTFC